MTKRLPQLLVILFTLSPSTASATGPPTVVTFPHADPLIGTRTETVTGARVGIDGCAFAIPPLVVPAAQQAGLERRQIAIDYEQCTTTLETGIAPRAVGPGAQGGAASFDGPLAPEDPGGGGGGYIQRTSSYEVYWHDVVELTMNDTRAVLTWKYNGLCAIYVSNSGYWWWNTSTGWNLDDPNSYTWHSYDGCNYEESHARGEFWNTEFCGWRVETHVQDISIRGWYTSAQSGHINGDISSSTSCGPLHWHDHIEPA